MRSDLSTGDTRIRRVYSYVAAAASVIVLIGVFSIYHFLLKPEPAAPQQKGLMIDSEVRPDTELKSLFKVEGYEDFDDYIKKNVNHLEAGLEQGVSDSVKVEFFINKKGKVENVSVVEGSNDILNKEAIRVVSSSPPWIPAEKNGEKIKKKMTVTVKFDLK